MQELQSAPSYPVKQVQESLLHALFCLWWMKKRPRLSTVPLLLHLHAGKQLFVTIFLFYGALLTNPFDDLYTFTKGKVKKPVFTIGTFFSNNIIGFALTWALRITGCQVSAHCITSAFWNDVIIILYDISDISLFWYLTKLFLVIYQEIWFVTDIVL